MENLSEATKVLVGLLITFIVSTSIWWLYKKYFIEKQIEKIAQIFFKMHQNLLLNNYTMNPIEANKFQSLDLDYYENVFHKLSSSKFQLIGDFENLINKNIKLPIDYFFRLMISDDGKIKASFYQLKEKNISHKIIEFTTETSNGTVYITSNSKLDSKLEYPKEILYEFLYTDITDKILQMHLARLKKIETIEKQEILKVTNFLEIVEQNIRIQDMSNNFRRNIKKDTLVKELKNFASVSYNFKENDFEKIAYRILQLQDSGSSKEKLTL